VKVLMVGDSPLIKSGFGKVNSVVLERLLSEGHEVRSVAGLTTEAPKESPIQLYVPKKGDQLGLGSIMEACEDFKPDVLYATVDPGSLTMLTYASPDLPMFPYVLIEGEPIPNRAWRIVLKSLPFMAVTDYAKRVVKQELDKDVDFSYHGINHDIFRVNGTRDAVRKNMKWEDKFVITVVSQNVRRKQLPRLIEAVAKLKHIYKQKDIILYMHTVPFQNYWLEGWNLVEIVRMYQIEDMAFFHPAMMKFMSAVPEGTEDPDKPGLAELYNASDLFVLPSQVEGFGLPIAEAMACGVPVLVTKYASGWEVAQPAGRGIPVHDWEVHKSGTVYANISVDALAKEILRLKRSPSERARMSAAGLQRVKDFTWEPYLDKLVPNLEQAIVTHQERDKSTEAGDTKQEARQEEVPNPEG
jgi:glycosyltransferase involved in cell wall biosynthesis